MADSCCVSCPMIAPPSSSRSTLSAGEGEPPCTGRLPPLAVVSMTTEIGKQPLLPVQASNGTKMIVAKVGPSFTSSDLFTPFSTPRTTLPSIAQFVRPSYGHENTWGMPTSTYGGVGSEAEQMEKKEIGSKSRGHKHFGCGCVNIHAPPQPHRVTALQLSQCRPCDQLLPKPLLTNEVVKRQSTVDMPGKSKYTSHLSQFAVFPSHLPQQQDIEQQSERPVLTPRTMEALSNLHSNIYCRSTYKKDYQHTSDDSSPCQSSDEEEGSIEETCDDSRITCECTGNECLDSEGKIDSCPSNYEEDVETSKSSETDHMTVLPGHVIITHPSQLPDHFRRVTSKYTRNKNTSVLHYVPCHLVKKPSLLLPTITPEYASNISHREHQLAPLAPEDRRVRLSVHPTVESPCIDNPGYGRSHDMTNMLPSLQPITDPHHSHPTHHSQLTTSEGVLPAVVTPRTRLRSTILHRLGVGYKSNAHARYHSIYPDKSPDLRDSQIYSKKVTFYGYHASVFRGC